MCDPVSVGVATTTIATVAQGYAAKQQGKYENKVAQYNARTMENEATQVRNLGIEEENRVREETAQLLSQQRAALGARNVNLEKGTALDIQESTMLFGDVDALRIRSGFEQKAESLEEGAELTRAAGAASEKMGKRMFSGTLLAGAGQFLAAPVAAKWFSSKSEGYIPNAFGQPQAAGLLPAR